ncbi:hypothetical protein BaRGS_00029332 [Batillaria attramentaria]|uniref:Uncharacterized protein n=1 Tax=Batillaria attramentaria TaxID=370345 RepID=A0ABD0JXM8_9CAEN
MYNTRSVTPSSAPVRRELWYYSCHQYWHSGIVSGKELSHMQAGSHWSKGPLLGTIVAVSLSLDRKNEARRGGLGFGT